MPKPVVPPDMSTRRHVFRSSVLSIRPVTCPLKQATVSFYKMSSYVWL